MTIESNLTRREQETLDSSLHEVVSQKNLTETARLIAARANVNSREDLLGWTPLQIAVSKRWTEGCHLLLNQGANLQGIEDTRDQAFLTRAALSQGHQLGAPSDAINQRRLLQKAIRNNNLETICDLIQKNAPLSPEDQMAIYTLLRQAILKKRGVSETIGFLLQQIIAEQADVLLWHAIRVDRTELLPYFLEAGIDVTHGLTYAVLENKNPTAEYFIRAGADVNRALEAAVRGGELRRVQYLISAGADKNVGLNEAVRADRRHIVRYFVANGAVPTVDTLKIAVQNNRQDLAALFIDMGIKPTEKIMRVAVEESELDLVRFLIESGCPIDEETQSELTNRLINEQCSNIHLFLQVRRPKPNEIEVYGENGFESPSSVDRKSLTKPLFILNIASYDTSGQHFGSITQYYTQPFNELYDKIAQRFTLVRVRVADPDELVPTIDRIKAAFPGLPLLHWALNGHGSYTAIGLGGRTRQLFTVIDTPIMRGIGKRIHRNGTISVWGCENGAERHNLASIFSRHAFPAIVFASPKPVSCVIPNIFQLTATTPVFAPFFQDDYGQPEFVRAYRKGTKIADGYKLPSRI